MSKSKCLDSNSSNSSNHNIDLEDIHYLSYLEMLKRFKDCESNIFQKVKKTWKESEEAEMEYNRLYAKYVLLIKLSATNRMLLVKCPVDTSVETTDSNLTTMLKNKNFDNIIDAHNTISTNILKGCKKKLQSLKNYDNMEQVCEGHMENKKLFEKIQCTTKSAERTVCTAVEKTFNHIIDAQ